LRTHWDECRLIAPTQHSNHVAEEWVLVSPFSMCGGIVRSDKLSADHLAGAYVKGWRVEAAVH
jgi:hypothetical protein